MITYDLMIHTAILLLLTTQGMTDCPFAGHSSRRGKYYRRFVIGPHPCKCQCAEMEVFSISLFSALSTYPVLAPQTRLYEVFVFSLRDNVEFNENIKHIIFTADIPPSNRINSTFPLYEHINITLF